MKQEFQQHIENLAWEWQNNEAFLALENHYNQHMILNWLFCDQEFYLYDFKEFINDMAIIEIEDFGLSAMEYDHVLDNIKPEIMDRYSYLENIEICGQNIIFPI